MKYSDPFTQDIRQDLEQAQLDSNLKQQLINARYLALNEQPNRKRQRFLVPAFALVSICAVVASLILLIPNQQQANPNSLEAFEIITSNDELEMYQDLEFYLWLEEQDMDKV